jgi:hypothetical protein
MKYESSFSISQQPASTSYLTNPVYTPPPYSVNISFPIKKACSVSFITN